MHNMRELNPLPQPDRPRHGIRSLNTGCRQATENTSKPFPVRVFVARVFGGPRRVTGLYAPWIRKLFSAALNQNNSIARTPQPASPAALPCLRIAFRGARTKIAIRQVPRWECNGSNGIMMKFGMQCVSDKVLGTLSRNCFQSRCAGRAFAGQQAFGFTAPPGFGLSELSLNTTLFAGSFTR